MNRRMRVLPTISGCLGTLVLALALSGCSWVSAVPTTVSEVKQVLLAKEQSYSEHIEKVVPACVHALNQLGFQLERVEHLQAAGLVRGAYGSTKVKLELEYLTPNLTLVKSRITIETGKRQYAVEEELFQNIDLALALTPAPNLKEEACGLVRIHEKPDSQSRIVAFLAPGTEVDVIEVRDKWKCIGLEIDDAKGYLYLP